MLQQLPGGLCFSHGPYDEYGCPQWPKCITDPQKQEWIDLADKRNKHEALMQAAGILEFDNLLPATVIMLRQKAEAFE